MVNSHTYNAIANIAREQDDMKGEIIAEFAAKTWSVDLFFVACVW